MTQLDQFYLNQKEPLAGCLISLRQFILDYGEHVTEKWYYRLPCFFYKGKLLCYVWTDKKNNEPYIAFYPANRLHHPLLELGSRVSSKILRIDPLKDLPIETIYEIIEEAIAPEIA